MLCNTSRLLLTTSDNTPWFSKKAKLRGTITVRQTTKTLQLTRQVQAIPPYLAHVLYAITIIDSDCRCGSNHWHGDRVICFHFSRQWHRCCALSSNSAFFSSSPDMLSFSLSVPVKCLRTLVLLTCHVLHRHTAFEDLVGSKLG